MKKSFLIPCTYKHLECLKNISKILDIVTVKPDEVIIHISGCPEKFEHIFLKDLFLNKEYSFHYKIFEENRDAGTNRNNLAEEATGDILIFQDADDFFHPQRIEVIEKSFEEEGVMHLVHSYHFNRKPLEEIQFEKINFCSNNVYALNQYHKLVFPDKKCDYSTHRSYGFFDEDRKKHLSLEYPVCNGPVSIRKEVFQKVRWKTRHEARMIAEDQDFNFECFYHFNKSFILLEKIYYYNLEKRTNGGFI